MTYPMTVGRSFAEVLCALDAPQTTVKRGVATPANRAAGQVVVIPIAVNDEAAKGNFGDLRTVLPYLRMTSLLD